MLVLEIAYNGEHYHGWQVQPILPTVQGTLTASMEKLLLQKVSITGCSRTDAGVHARQFICTLETESPIGIPMEKFCKVANHMLPSDIVIKKAWHAPEGFHPRFDVKSKEYCYEIQDGAKGDPFLSGLVWQLPYTLDTEKMNVAAQYLVGTHDFSAFCCADACEDRVRTIFSIGVTRQNDRVVLSITGNGFLYNMVRIITGTLVDVSTGRFSPVDIERILLSKDRTKSGRTAPPEGLYLNRVVF